VTSRPDGVRTGLHGIAGAEMVCVEMDDICMGLSATVVIDGFGIATGGKGAGRGVRISAVPWREESAG